MRPKILNSHTWGGLLAANHVSFLKRAEITFKEIPWIVGRSIAGFTEPANIEFCRKMMSGGFERDKRILALPRCKLPYVATPKAASTQIRKTLARVEGRFSRSLRPSKRSNYRGSYGPRKMTIGSFHQPATDPATLRFSFVRNPYARIVSCRADKFAFKPLVGGGPFTDAYMAARQEVDPRLPTGVNCSLSFADFVSFVAGAADRDQDSHIQPQPDILRIPGIELDFIGKVETFDTDFARILDHLKVADEVRREAAAGVNESYHDDWPNYFTGELAERIYRVYECDFDQFCYSRSPL